MITRQRQVVAITGASAGVGRATAEAFAREHAAIALLARGQERLEETRQRVEELGGKALVIPTDVADFQQVEAAAERIERELGPIDIWINNAMTSVFSTIDKMQPPEYQRVTDVTYLGQVWGALAALKRMRPRDRGVIVFVGSALAYRGIPAQSAYCAAKHATQGFFDSLRTELLHDKSNVHISMVQLPGVNTPQFEWVKTRLPGKPKPMGAVYQPEVAARAILWAAHHRRREIIVGAPAAKAIMANKFWPAYLDRHLAQGGIEGQQGDEPVQPDRPDNLWEPAPGHFGAHGRFDAISRRVSPQFWAAAYRGLVATAAACAAGFVYGSLSRRKR